MSKATTGPEIERLVQLLARLPGLGPRSARKAALALIKRRSDLLEPLAAAMAVAAEKIVICAACANVDTISPCTICQDPKRDPTLIVVVEEVGDLWALERAGVVSARYHVLGGHLSPLDGIGPEQLNLDGLIARARPPVQRDRRRFLERASPAATFPCCGRCRLAARRGPDLGGLPLRYSRPPRLRFGAGRPMALSLAAARIASAAAARPSATSRRSRRLEPPSRPGGRGRGKPGESVGFAFDGRGPPPERSRRGLPDSSGVPQERS